MKLKDNIINLLKRLGQAQPVRKHQPPESLPPEVMKRVMEEIHFLRSQHAVDVRELAPGETPSDPKPAGETTKV